VRKSFCHGPSPSGGSQGCGGLAAKPPTSASNTLMHPHDSRMTPEMDAGLDEALAELGLGPLAKALAHTRCRCRTHAGARWPILQRGKEDISGLP
jgi:hypothetical protein